MWSIGFPGSEPPSPMDAFGLLGKARELGVKAVQYGPNLPLDSLSDADLGLLIRRAREWGIEIEVGTRGFDQDTLRPQIELAQRVGATLLRTVPDYARAEPVPAGWLVEQLAPNVPDLAAAGVRLAVENASVPARTLAQAMRQLATPWVGITLDTVNSLAIPEGTEEVARALAPYTFSLHIKDFVVERVWHMMGFRVEGRPAGKGQLDIPWLLELLRAAGVAPNAILELWPPAQETLDRTIELEQAWAVSSVEYFRRLVSG